MFDVGFIYGVLYPECLANPVFVPKGNGKLQCVGYIDINKDCPKDPSPLPASTKYQFHSRM